VVIRRHKNKTTDTVAQLDSSAMTRHHSEWH